jgi:hypothetical protein
MTAARTGPFGTGSSSNGGMRFGESRGGSNGNNGFGRNDGSGFDMQSTHAGDKRTDVRRACRTRLRLEDARVDQELRVTAFNYSKGGLLIQADRALWPGMEFRIKPEGVSNTADAADWPGTVRWCKAIRAPGAAITYNAGLQFCSSNRRFRPDSQFRVIPGGADRIRVQPCATPPQRSPSSAIRTAAQPSEGQGRPE